MTSQATIRRSVEHHYHKQDGKCHYCGEEVFLRWEVTREFRKGNQHRMATFDHVIPKSKGGTYKRENGVCACMRCNSSRGNMDYHRFVKNCAEIISRSERKKNRRAKKEITQRLAKFLLPFHNSGRKETAKRLKKFMTAQLFYIL